MGTGKPDYIFKNGDTISIGFIPYQVLDGELRKVMDWINVDGIETDHYYIKPGESFTYLVKEE